MIYLLTLLLTTANASNWMRVDDIKAGLQRGFELKESCEIKDDKYIVSVPCPSELGPNDMCPFNISCVEIGNIAPDVVGVDESQDVPVAIIDPSKKAIKDQKEAEASAKKVARDQALANLKAAPPVIPANQMSAMIHDLLTSLGIK